MSSNHGNEILVKELNLFQILVLIHIYNTGSNIAYIYTLNDVVIIQQTEDELYYALYALKRI